MMMTAEDLRCVLPDHANLIFLLFVNGMRTALEDWFVSLVYAFPIRDALVIKNVLKAKYVKIKPVLFNPLDVEQIKIVVQVRFVTLLKAEYVLKNPLAVKKQIVP